MPEAPAWLQLLVLALGVARLTVLATSDRITRRWRWWLERRPGYVSWLGWCPWCAGWWIALVAAGGWLRWPVGTATALVPWAVAFVASAAAAGFGGEDRLPSPPPPPPEVLAKMAHESRDGRRMTPSEIQELLRLTELAEELRALILDRGGRPCLTIWPAWTRSRL